MPVQARDGTSPLFHWESGCVIPLPPQDFCSPCEFVCLIHNAMDTVGCCLSQKQIQFLTLWLTMTCHFPSYSVSSILGARYIYQILGTENVLSLLILCTKYGIKTWNWVEKQRMWNSSGILQPSLNPLTQWSECISLKLI